MKLSFTALQLKYCFVTLKLPNFLVQVLLQQDKDKKLLNSVYSYLINSLCLNKKVVHLCFFLRKNYLKLAFMILWDLSVHETARFANNAFQSACDLGKALMLFKMHM